MALSFTTRMFHRGNTASASVSVVCLIILLILLLIIVPSPGWCAAASSSRRRSIADYGHDAMGGGRFDPLRSILRDKNNTAAVELITSLRRELQRNGELQQPSNSELFDNRDDGSSSSISDSNITSEEIDTIREENNIYNNINDPSSNIINNNNCTICKGGLTLLSDKIPNIRIDENETPEFTDLTCQDWQDIILPSFIPEDECYNHKSYRGNA